MRIALIFTPVLLDKNWTALTAQDRHMGRIPPLSLCYAAATAEQAGHQVTIIDAAAERLSPAGTAERIKLFRPDLLGFTLTTYGLHQTLAWIRVLKRMTGLPVMAGGVHLSFYPAETMSHGEIDYAVIGEAEQSLPGFLSALGSGGSLERTDGIAFRKDGKVLVRLPSGAPPSVDNLPVPARHLLDNSLYFNILSRRKNFTAVLSARGCPFRCIFCDLTSKPFRMRGAADFVNEVRDCHARFGIREFDIYDSSFTMDRDRAAMICEGFLRAGLRISWTARTRADSVDGKLLSIMKRAGCSTIMYGIESGDPEILRGLCKAVDLARIRESVRLTVKNGIRALGFFMIGSPGETPETAARTLAFSRELGLDYVQFTRTMPLPGTELYRRLLDSGRPDYWRAFTLTGEMAEEIPVPGTEMTAQTAKLFVVKGYRQFYFRTGYIVKSLMKIGSLMELKNKAGAALGLLKSSG